MPFGFRTLVGLRKHVSASNEIHSFWHLQVSRSFESHCIFVHKSYERCEMTAVSVDYVVLALPELPIRAKISKIVNVNFFDDDIVHVEVSAYTH